MKREIAVIRLIAAATVALGFALGGTLLAAAPAAAQEATPWYMPQPWVHPPKTGPSIRKLPGYYGHNYRGRSYGSFSTSCYGSCRILRGTVRTGYGVNLSRPMVVVFDPRGYQIVPRFSYVAQPSYAAPGYAVPSYAAPAYAAPGYATPGFATPGGQPQARQPVAATPAPYVVRSLRKSLPKYTVQHGVRIIYVKPITTN